MESSSTGPLITNFGTYLHFCPQLPVAMPGVPEHFMWVWYSSHFVSCLVSSTLHFFIQLHTTGGLIVLSHLTQLLFPKLNNPPHTETIQYLWGCRLLVTLLLPFLIVFHRSWDEKPCPACKHPHMNGLVMWLQHTTTHLLWRLSVFSLFLPSSAAWNTVVFTFPGYWLDNCRQLSPVIPTLFFLKITWIMLLCVHSSYTASLHIYWHKNVSTTGCCIL